MAHTDIERQRRLREECERIVRVIVRKVQPERVLLCGSLARGEVTATSDIDLVLVARSEKPLLDRLGDLYLLTRPRIAADLFWYTPEEWERLSQQDPFVRSELVSGAKVLYERP